MLRQCSILFLFSIIISNRGEVHTRKKEGKLTLSMKSRCKRCSHIFICPMICGKNIAKPAIKPPPTKLRPTVAPIRPPTSTPHPPVAPAPPITPSLLPPTTLTPPTIPSPPTPSMPSPPPPAIPAPPIIPSPPPPTTPAPPVIPLPPPSETPTPPVIIPTSAPNPPPSPSIPGELSCPIRLEKKGCFKDNQKAPRPLPNYILTDRDNTLSIFSGKEIDWGNWINYLPDLVCRCAQLAKSKHFKYFGIQYYGECWSGPSKDENSFKEDGVSTECVNTRWKICSDQSKFACAGKEYTNYVYAIV